MLVGITADSNGKDIANTLASTDDCWFSTGQPIVTLTLKFSCSQPMHVPFRKIELEFQTGFHPRNIEIGGAVIPMSPTQKSLILQSDSISSECSIRLLNSYDPYGRFCIYAIREV